MSTAVAGVGFSPASVCLFICKNRRS